MKRLYCSKCGNRVELNANFCEHCGNKVSETSGLISEADDRTRLDDDSTHQETDHHRSNDDQFNDSYEEIASYNYEFDETYEDQTNGENSVEEDMIIYVGKNSDFYDQKWKTAETKGTSWNWPGFLFAIGWLGYRKMYKHVLLISLFFLLIDIFLYFLDSFYNIGFILESLDNGLGIGLAVFIGFYGNILYRKHTQKNVLLIRNTEPNLKEREFQLRKKGGASWGGVFIAIGIFLLFYFLPAIFIPYNYYTIEGVKGGTFYDYPDVTVEAMFDEVFEDTSWEVASDDTYTAYDIVQFNGSKREYDHDFAVNIQFIFDDDDDGFQVLTIMIDGDELDAFEMYDFLDYIFLEYESF